MNISRTAIAALLVVMLMAGCAGKRAAKADANSEQNPTAKDMTRPPTTIGEDRKIVVESNPDETISFEEWKRRQAVEAAKRGDAEPE